jgi:chemotaxis protein CheD
MASLDTPKKMSRYWDKYHEVQAVKILPGEYYASAENEVIVTVLGSCISVCIHDPVMKIGGMNHFMLPGFHQERVEFSSHSGSARYGLWAMEMLINNMLKMGGIRQNFVLKIFGGGHIIESMETMSIGDDNIHFIREYVKREGLSVLAEDVGGPCARKVYLFPNSGKVRVKKISKLNNDTLLDREVTYIKAINQQKPKAGDVDLF